MKTCHFRSRRHPPAIPVQSSISNSPGTREYNVTTKAVYDETTLWKICDKHCGLLNIRLWFTVSPPLLESSQFVRINFDVASTELDKTRSFAVVQGDLRGCRQDGRIKDRKLKPSYGTNAHFDRASPSLRYFVSVSTAGHAPIHFRLLASLHSMDLSFTSAYSYTLLDDRRCVAS